MICLYFYYERSSSAKISKARVYRAVGSLSCVFESHTTQLCLKKVKINWSLNMWYHTNMKTFFDNIHIRRKISHTDRLYLPPHWNKHVEVYFMLIFRSHCSNLRVLKITTNSDFCWFLRKIKESIEILHLSYTVV